MKHYSIAIDGPSGAGKSTLAKALAKQLGYIYVDTGAMYRAIGLYAYREGIALSDVSGVVKLLPRIKVELEYGEDGTQMVLLNGKDVSTDIRLPQISMYASAVSALPPVREFLLDLQRGMAEKQNVIMDGRDIGTVILPFADVKIFLHAGSEHRARRRLDELTEKGIQTDYETVLKEMVARDQADSTRAVAPAVPAKDAVMLDNSGFALEDTVKAAMAIIKEKIG